MANLTRTIQKSLPDEKNQTLARFFESPSYQAMKKYINSPKGGVKKTTLGYRKISHWAKKGVIEFSQTNKKKGWKTFTARELVWIGIVQTLRDMNVSLPFIKKIRDDIFGPPGSPSDRVKYFDLYIFFSLTRERIHLIVAENGQCEFVSAQELNLFIDRGTFPTDYISVDLGTISRDILIKEGLKAKSSNLLPLKENELRLWEQILNADNETIKVEIKNGNIHHFSDTKDNDALKEELNKVIRRYYPKDSYGSIEINVRNGGVDRARTTISHKE